VTRAAYQSRQLGNGYGLRSLESQFGSGLTQTGRLTQVSDVARARTIGDRFGRFWLRGIDASPTGELIVPKVIGRLDSIAISEASQSFNQERRAIVREQIATRSGVTEIWDAQLDACQVCDWLNGKRTVMGSFPGGQSPGGVHPRCRCTCHFEVDTNFNLLPYIAAGATYGWM
jgi:hypothetical protein